MNSIVSFNKADETKVVTRFSQMMKDRKSFLILRKLKANFNLKK